MAQSLALLLLAVGAHADKVDFSRDILPLLESRCHECHGGAKHKGGLRLDNRADAIKGGDASDHVIVLGSAEKSELILRVTSDDPDLRMPPKGERLSRDQVAILKRWIDEGAQWPVAANPIDPKADSFITAEHRRYWAFQPVANHPPPAVKRTDWVRTPIDAFVLAKLDAAKLSPAPTATRLQLIRRVAFDLTGLPPTPEEIDAFATDDASDAYERMVERYLASPHYGERQAQHWLDLVRFAETEGFEYDRTVPGLWRFRDYVIRSFNDDKPFNEFLTEQIAGDELAQAPDVAEPDRQKMLIAAGLHRLGPVRRNAGNQEVASSRNEVLTERTDIIGAAFLGLTIGCARCHDHKFDPIRQRDYYHLQAFVAGTEEHNISLAGAEEQAAWKKQTDAATAQITRLKRQVRDLEGEERVRVQKQIEELEDSLPAPLATIATVQNSESPTPIHVLRRGDADKKGDVVGMRMPAVLSSEERELPPATPNPRTQLARWLASPSHPLTARVLVNRIWQQHFSHGLLRTANDFGVNGERPSHPELLDYLAWQLVSGNWQIKPLHRQILLSSTYHQSASISSGGDQDAARIDPDNRLLSHFPRRRLSAEEARDAMLLASGRLNRKLFGESVIIPVDKELVAALYKPSQWTVTRDIREHDRRSIYLLAKRNLRLPFMEVFDQPVAQNSCARRESSTHAPQSLELLNGRTSNDLAAAFAKRLETEAPGDRREQINLAFRIAASRLPTQKELDVAERFLQSQSMREFCLALFNLNAFLYVE